jgi:DNA-binding PadR family transcriptional regulator
MDLPSRHVATQREVLPLSSAAFLVLLTLFETDMHAYGLLEELRRLEPPAAVGPATLYRTLRQMVTDGWLVQSRGAQGDDPRRRYFRLTAVGRRIAVAEARRLESLVATARRNTLLPARGTP